MNAPSPAGRLLPVVAITGFLGSGKTTTLQHLLSSSPWKPGRSALIINDFGAVNIDAALLARPELQVESISGGCICCTSFGELIDQLDRLASMPDLDIVWLESSGLTEPDELLDHLSDSRLAGRVIVHTLIAVVDAGDFPASWRHRAVEAEQLTYADVIAINKSDLVPPAKLEKIDHAIRHLNERAEIAVVQRGAVNPLLIWNRKASKRAATVCGCGHDHGHDGHDHQDHHSHDHHHHDHDEPTATSATSVHLPLPAVIRRADLDSFLSALPGSVYRAKGFLRLDGDPSTMRVFQKVREQRDLLLLPAGLIQDPQPGIILIGPGLDLPSIHSLFKSFWP